MPGLTVITNGTQATPASASAAAHGSGAGSAPQPPPSNPSQHRQPQQPPPTTTNTTPDHPPQPAPNIPHNPQTRSNQTLPPPKRNPHPPPTIPDFSLSRPLLSHTSQAPTPSLIIPPPQPVPLDFDSNPDVLALKSAISILQLQRQRAQADIQSLHRAKLSALSDPAAFVADLTSGKVGQKEEGLFGGSPPSDDSDDDSDNDDEDGDDDTKKQDGEANKEKEPAWRKLPKPQTVVRCPPINWSQYAVVGESLDKLHAEQLKAPTPGVPQVVTGTNSSSGTFEFTAGNAGTTSTAGLVGSNQPQKLVGIAAPYVPGRDKIEKKGRGGKRS
ncbi:hypothetical protein B0T21DRAFT_392694 [Apiosordaria backusii]|uniref:Uncharacterized protein n=1 Tax=Apiosordaria backusii TaxID=314023 RepID=A0AA40BNT9_9PEZI|nr:hypothetical protein B0T21DRAFT_392694 [Apiosordaria backusii]